MRKLNNILLSGLLLLTAVAYGKIVEKKSFQVSQELKANKEAIMITSAAEIINDSAIPPLFILLVLPGD